MVNGAYQIAAEETVEVASLHKFEFNFRIGLEDNFMIWLKMHQSSLLLLDLPSSSKDSVLMIEFCD